MKINIFSGGLEKWGAKAVEGVQGKLGVSMFERRVEIEPAYDKRHANPAKNYGIHNAELKFYLIGPEGAVQFIASTGWYLPKVEKEFEHSQYGKPKAWGTDLGYHSPTPRYEGQTLLTPTCSILNGPCYYDGSTLNAEPFFECMVAEGHEAVWNKLEEYYQSIFMRLKHD